MCTEAEYKLQADITRLATQMESVDHRLERQSETINLLRDEVKDLRREDAHGDVKHAEYEQRIKQLERIAWGGSAVGSAGLLGHLLPAINSALGG